MRLTSNIRSLLTHNEEAIDTILCCTTTHSFGKDRRVPESAKKLLPLNSNLPRF
jgi:hypothetical protein